MTETSVDLSQKYWYFFGNVLINKTRLVTKGYSQLECIDLDKTYAHVTQLVAIKMSLAFSCIVFLWNLLDGCKECNLDLLHP